MRARINAIWALYTAIRLHKSKSSNGIETKDWATTFPVVPADVKFKNLGPARRVLARDDTLICMAFKQKLSSSPISIYINRRSYNYWRRKTICKNGCTIFRNIERN